MSGPLTLLVHYAGGVEIVLDVGGTLQGGSWRLERYKYPTPYRHGRLVVDLGEPMLEEVQQRLGQQAAEIPDQPDLAAAVVNLTALLKEKLP